MTEHLSDEQLARFLSEEGQVETRMHVEQCEACARELAELQAALGTVPGQAQHAAQQSHSFWRAQRLAVSARIARAPGPHARLAWSVAFAAMVLAAVLLNRPVENADAVVAQTDPDHELLVSVEQSVRRRVPEALAPAELLLAELNTAAKAQPNP